MKKSKILALFLLLLVPVSSKAQWQPVTELQFLTDNAFSRGHVFVNTYTGQTVPTGCAPATWCTVDVTSMGVPADAKTVFLSGILIITHGTTQETADMQIGFRAFGDNQACATPQAASCVWYNGQVTEAHIGGGQRSTMATWVPVRGGKFQFFYTLATQGTWPLNSSYGVNLTAQAWGR